MDGWMDGWMKWMSEAPKPTPWDTISRDTFTKSKTMNDMGAHPPPNYLLLYCCHWEYNKTKLYHMTKILIWIKTGC
jgi:hypothetical protein